jgi:hypothetical protein
MKPTYGELPIGRLVYLDHPGNAALLQAMGRAGW